MIAWLKSGLSAKYRKPVCLGHAAALSVLEWPRNPRAGINADRRPLLTPEEQGFYLNSLQVTVGISIAPDTDDDVDSRERLDDLGVVWR